MSRLENHIKHKEESVMSAIYDKLTEVLVSHFGLDTEDIQPEVTFPDLGMDSLSMVELSVVLQDDYGIDIEGIDIDPKGSLAQAAVALGQAGITAHTPSGGRDVP
jgi:acyl carrier protein